jgi:hypothetical protein
MASLTVGYVWQGYPSSGVETASGSAISSLMLFTLVAGVLVGGPAFFYFLRNRRTTVGRPRPPSKPGRGPVPVGAATKASCGWSLPSIFVHTRGVVVAHSRTPFVPAREIYRAGRQSPIQQSSVYFQTMAAASRAGKEALKRVLDKLHAEHLRWPAA